MNEWAPSALAAPWANPPPSPDSCLKLEAFPLKEQVKFPFPSHRNMTDTSALEDSFLTVSWGSWAVSEWDSQQMCCRLNKLQCSLSLRGVIASHAPSAADGEKEGNKTWPCHSPRGRAATAQLPGFIHFVPVTSQWCGGCLAYHLKVQPGTVEIPLVMGNCIEGKWESFQHLRKTCTHVHTILLSMQSPTILTMRSHCRFP